MGSAAGTGIRSFAEGGSTSPQTDSPAAPRRAVYRPEYTDYSSGLGSTPQAGYLASIIGKGLPSASYQNRMPTFTRPSAPEAQPAYRIPYRAPSNNDVSRVFNTALSGIFGNRRLSPEQQSANLIKDYRGANLTEAQYNNMMQNPAMYLNYLQRVEAGENPTSIGYAAPPPTRFMTAAQQQAYNQNVASQLESMIAPRTTFDMSDSSGDGA